MSKEIKLKHKALLKNFKEDVRRQLDSCFTTRNRKRISLEYLTHSVPVLCKSIDWFLYEGNTGTSLVNALYNSATQLLSNKFYLLILHEKNKCIINMPHIISH